MATHVLGAEAGVVYVSPALFRKAARDYLTCLRLFRDPKRFSVVPYFLCCRAIELALKAEHLESRRQKEVRNDYGHDLVTAYAGLPQRSRTLGEGDVALLRQANDIYSTKGFEYINPGDAATAFSGFPDLGALVKLAKKIVRARRESV